MAADPRFPSKTGFVKDPVDERDFVFRPGQVPGLPRSVDISPQYPAPLDQGQANTCTSNATANALLFLLGVGVPQSRLFIYWNARVKVAGWDPDSDTGLCIRDAMKSVATYKSVPESSWPYEPPQQLFKVPPTQAVEDQAAMIVQNFQYQSVPQDEASVKAALATGHPICLGILLLQSFESPGADGYVKMSGPQLGWHAVAIVGYDDATRRFKLQNSWGAGYGAGGFFYLDYDWVLNPATASDLWLLTAFSSSDAPVPVPAPTPTPQPVVIPPYPRLYRGITSFAVRNLATKRFLSAAPGAPTVTTVPSRDGSGDQVWVFSHVGGDERTFVVQPAADAPLARFLSANVQAGRLDLWTADDASGRQRFALLPTKVRDVYRILVVGGLEKPEECYVAEEAGAATLRARDDSPAQLWSIVR